MKKLIHAMVWVFAIGLSQNSMAQVVYPDTVSVAKKPDRFRYFRFGFTNGSVYFNDQFNSSLRYRGFQGGLYMAYHKIGPQALNDITFHTAGGFAQKDIEGNDDGSLIGIAYARPQANYSHLRYLPWISGERYNVWGGGYVDVSGSIRQNPSQSNSSVSYDFLTSLGIKAGIDYRWTLWNHEWRVFYTMGLPFLGWTYRPHYATVWEGEEYIRVEGGFFRNFFAIDTKAELQYFMKNGNMLGFGVGWYYTSMQEPHKVQFSGLYNGLFFSFKF